MRYSRSAPALARCGQVLPSVTFEFFGRVSWTMQVALCFDQIEPAFDAEEWLVQPIHPMLETREIGAETRQLCFYADELILNRSDSSRKILKTLHQRVLLAVDRPQHPQRQIFRFLGHRFLNTPAPSARYRPRRW